MCVIVCTHLGVSTWCRMVLMQNLLSHSRQCLHILLHLISIAFILPRWCVKQRAVDRCEWFSVCSPVCVFMFLFVFAYFTRGKLNRRVFCRCEADSKQTRGNYTKLTRSAYSGTHTQNTTPAPYNVRVTGITRDWNTSTTTTICICSLFDESFASKT